jgi:hypothetical protein
MSRDVGVVAHAAASQVPSMNCKQPFLSTVQGMNAVLTHGWFRPFVAASDGARKANAFGTIGHHNSNRSTIW